MAKTQTITWFHTPSFVSAGSVVTKLRQEGFKVQVRPCADVTQINIINAPAEDAPNIFLTAVYESKDFGKGLDPIEAFMAEMAQSLYSKLTGGDTFMKRVALLQDACVPGTHPVKTTVEEIQEAEGGEGEVSLEELNKLMLQMAFQEPSLDSMQTLVDTMRRCSNPLAQHQLPEFEKLLQERKAIEELNQNLKEILESKEGVAQFLDKTLSSSDLPEEDNLVETSDGRYISLGLVKAFCAGFVGAGNAKGFKFELPEAFVKDVFDIYVRIAVETLRGEETGGHRLVEAFSTQVKAYFLK